jgi:hypothetical protein
VEGLAVLQEIQDLAHPARMQAVGQLVGDQRELLEDRGVPEEGDDALLTEGELVVAVLGAAWPADEDVEAAPGAVAFGVFFEQAGAEVDLFGLQGVADHGDQG